MPLRAAHETHGGVFISFYVFILKLLAAINLRCPKQNGRNEGMAWQNPCFWEENLLTLCTIINIGARLSKVSTANCIKENQ